MFEAIVAIVVLFVALPMVKVIFKAITKDATRAISNTTTAVANATGALPTMGAQFAASTIADSLKEVENLKQAIGCNNPEIKTMVQLNSWMEQNNMV